jgi:hypothetical protein
MCAEPGHLGPPALSAWPLHEPTGLNPGILSSVHLMLTRSLLVFALAATLLPAQTLTLAEGSPTALQIVSLAENNPNGGDTVVLQNVELLPIEITGRTLARELDASRSRRTVENGIERVELPGGGRLFRYKRNGGQFWGFLHIAADGSARVVLERAGVGAALDDPYFDSLAVAEDGLHAAVALQGGGVYVMKLDGTLYASTNSPNRRAIPTGTEAIPGSLMVGTSHLFLQSEDDEVWRCSLADGAVPDDVSPPLVANGLFKDEMVLSRNGQQLVFLYGPRDLQRLWRVDTVMTSPAVLPPPPSKYEEPGYLPFGAGEPAMLLSDDGARLFYVDADVRDELHLLDMTGVLPDLQITESQIFEPYIGSHILPKFAAHELVVAIGDVALMDWFKVSLSSQGGSVTNLTGTGSLAQPFPSGALAPVQAADTGGALLIFEQTATNQVLRRLDPVTGAQSIVQQDVVGAPMVGSSLTGSADTLVRSSSGDFLYRGGTANPFASTPAGLELTPPVHGPLLAGTWLHLASNWGVVVLYLPDGTLLAGPVEFGVRQIAMTAAGGVVLVGSGIRYVNFGVNETLNRPNAVVRVVLSGAGG